MGENPAPPEARMPQLKKVVLAMAERLIYRNSFDEALTELIGEQLPFRLTATTVAATPTPPQGSGGDIPALAERLRHLRDQAERLARELEALKSQSTEDKISFAA